MTARKYLLMLIGWSLAACLWAERTPVEALIRKGTKAMDELAYGQLRPLSDSLMAYAKAHDDKRIESYAYYYRGTSLLYTGKGKYSMADIGKARALAESIGNDSIVALTYNSTGIYEASTMLNLFLAQHYFLKSLQYAEKSNFDWLKGRIFGNLAILSKMQEDTAGLQYAVKCYEYGRRNMNHRMEHLGAYKMAELYLIRRDRKTADKYFRIALALQEKYRFDDFSSLIIHATILKEVGKYAEAEKVLARTIRSKGVQELFLPDAYMLYAQLFYARRNYREAAKMAQKALALAEKHHVNTSVSDCYLMLSRCHEALGEREKAFGYLKKSEEMSRLIHAVDKEHLKKECEMAFELIRKEGEVKLNHEKIKNQHQVNLMLVCSVILLLTLLVVLVLNYRKRMKLYRNIVKQNTLALAREQDLRTQIEQLKAEDLRKGNRKQLESDKVDELYERLCHALEDEKLYKEPQLTRERLSKILNTNHTYLTKVITEKTGMNFSQFVNSYRIHEAVRILSDAGNAEYPLKQLCFDLGFTSLSNFYKQFQDTVGMSPSAYRKSFRRMENEDSVDD